VLRDARKRALHFYVAFELVQKLCDFATRYATVKIQPALFEMTN
jgi:hypothetical protein